MLRPAFFVVAAGMFVGGVVTTAQAQGGTSPKAKVPDSLKTKPPDREPHTLSPVRVKARYQKRPSIYNFMETEPSVRSESLSPTTTDWFDPLSAGDAAALLRASPDMLIGPDGSASLMGAPASANQVQLGGMRVPASLVTGLNGASVTSSPWDITVGGAAGATVNFRSYPPRPYNHAQATFRSGLGGVPGWLGSSDQRRGIDVPIQLSAGMSGPVGKLGYQATAFFQRDNTNLPRWDRALGNQARSVLDSVSGVLGAPTVNARAQNLQVGAIGRVDFIPFDSKRVLALSGALTRSRQSGGPGGTFATGSLGAVSEQNVGLLQLLSKRVIGERVLWTSQIGTSISSSNTKRDATAPTIIATDAAAGNTIITGGVSQQPTSRVLTADAQSSAAWYSRDNKTHFIAQIEARGERARLGGSNPHSTFMTTSLAALQTGQAISLARESGSAGAVASSFVIAPAIGARRDVGNGSVMLGVRADAWRTDGIAASGTMQYVDVSPRVSLYQRLGHRSGNRGAVATLRMGVGRFTTWPEVQQWADAWTDAGITRELCSGSDVPSISLDVEAPSCTSGGVIQELGRVVAYGDMRPAASNRAEASLQFGEIVPGVTGTFGASVARNDRIATRISPLMNAPVVGLLGGDGGRALLVAESEISGGGVVPVVQIPNGIGDVTRLTAEGRSTVAQWRIALANGDPFQSLTWHLSYTLTTGRERSLAIASPTSAPSFVSGPLAGGEHALALSIGTWLGSASIHISALARSGVRFTPLADRDLNGDGRANDAAFIPAALSDAWANSVPSNVQSCIRASAGRIAGVNSCTGPWSVTSMMEATIPGPELGLSTGYEISLELSNPLAAFAGSRSVTFGGVGGVNPTLLHVTGFDPANQRFTGQPMSGFGSRLGLLSGISNPVRFAVRVRMPIGPTGTSQRVDAALDALESDTSAKTRSDAAMKYLGDIAPVPLMVMQSSRALRLTNEEVTKLQELASRWQATQVRLVLDAYGHATARDARGRASARARLLAARTEFWTQSAEMLGEIRELLNPDQIELLGGVKQMLNPRFWRYASLQDAGDISGF